MKLSPFKLERYFARHEFTAPYLLCGSDCEALKMSELLAMAESDTLQLWERLNLGYTESLGHPRLRQEISQLYPGLGKDDILVCTPEEGIFITMNVMLEAGDQVIVTFPGYQSLYGIADSIGCQVVRWLPREEETGWTFDLQWLESTLCRRTRLLVINFPHNPSGAVLSAEEFRHVLDLAGRYDCHVFADEMYRFLEYDPMGRPAAAATLYSRAISLGGLSKSFGLPGLRMGWLASGDKETMDRLATFKDFTTICSSAPSEILAIMALRGREKIWSRNLGIIRDNLAELDLFFEKYNQFFSWSRPTAGCIAFPRLLSGLTAEAFCADLLRKKGVLLLPAELYDYPEARFRIGFGRRNMPLALGKLDEYLEEFLI